MLNSHKKTIYEILGRNPIHPFPARMAAGIALEAIAETKASLKILDPMVGSGTVVAVAHAKGHRAYGIDLDPLSVLLAGVWTHAVNADRVSSVASDVMDRARNTFRKLSAANAYPDGSDEETQKFLRYWFDAYARRQLMALSSEIFRVKDKAVRDVLWAGFSRLIITKTAGASLAMDLSHSRPHRAFQNAPVKPFNRFLGSVEAVVANCPREQSGSTPPPAIVTEGDARTLNIESSSIDLVLTSPPYLNAIDYLRCSKFSLVWMGYTAAQLRLIRKQSVGTEASSKQAQDVSWITAIINDLALQPPLAARHNARLSQYVWDMDRALAETSRVLRVGGRAVYVVGDSTVRGTFIRNSAIVAAVAHKHGLVLNSQESRDLPPNRRYMPPPKRGGASTAMDGRMRQEVVLSFDKVGA